MADSAPETPAVIFGAGARRQLPALMDGRGWKRAFLLSTPGRSRDAAIMRKLLGARGAGEHREARVHVPVETIRAAHEAMAGTRADVLVAIGGGSAIGLGKALAVETGLPLAAIPTTYSGSEMTPIYGSTEGTTKHTGRHARAAPVLVIYDVELTFSLPPLVSAASGMNAIAHGVEALYAPNATPDTSREANDGISRMAAALPAIVDDPRDAAARGEAFHAAHLLGRALGATSMGLHHAIAHVLGGMGLSHAETHAVLLPHTAGFNGATPDAATLRALNRRLGLTLTLGDLGLARADIPRAAALVVARSYPNPRPVTDADVRGILEAAM